jgi:hypothetical protein
VCARGEGNTAFYRHWCGGGVRVSPRRKGRGFKEIRAVAEVLSTSPAGGVAGGPAGVLAGAGAGN